MGIFFIGKRTVHFREIGIGSDRKPMWLLLSRMMMMMMMMMLMKMGEKW
jgi:hypothetical protein